MRTIRSEVRARPARLLGAAASLLVGLAAACAPAGRSLSEFDAYTHVHQPPCGADARRVDPVLVAWVRGAEPASTADFVAAHTTPPWSHRVAVADQWFQVRGACSASVASVASAASAGAPDRYHIRFSQAIPTAGRWGRSLVSTPHYDAHCVEGDVHRHYVPAAIDGQTGFDHARDRLVEQMVAAGRTVRLVESWGNTATMGQRCGRPPTGSADGRVVLLEGPS